MANDPAIRFVSKADAKAIAQSAKAKYTNQNAIAKVKLGNETFTADEAQDLIELEAGTNVGITRSGDKFTFTATDTTYANAVAPATGVTGSDGLMAKEDKAKLDGIEAGAEVNQDAFSSITIGADTIVADAESDGFEIAGGSNVTVSASGDAITISAADTTYELAQDANDGHKITFTPSNGTATEITIPDSDTTYSGAIASVSGVGGTDGLLVATDKEKLDGIATGAQVNVLEGVKVNGTSLTPTDKVVDVTVTAGESGVGTIKVNGSQVTAYGLGSAAAATVETSGVDSDTTTLPTTAQVKTYVDGRMSSAYKPAGSLAAAGVTSSVLVAGNLGNVYNLSEDITLDATSAALFTDGTAGEKILEGTNIVVVNTGTASSPTYLFDAQAGFVDFSAYAKTADFGGLTAAELAEVIAEL